MNKEERIIMLLIRWFLTFLISFIFIGIASLIKPIDFINKLILFLNIEGTILIGFALTPGNTNWHNSVIAKLKWIVYGQPANGYAEPLVPNLLMLYTGILFIILANIISIVGK
jgi:hypothetical protein